MRCDSNGGGVHTEYQSFNPRIKEEQVQYMGSLPSNTESNPREQLNAITIQDKEGLVEPEPESRQGIVVSKGKGDEVHSGQKPVSELTLHVGDEAITPQARNSTNTDHVVQPSLQEIRSKSIHEPCSSYSKEPIYEERKLQIEELDEWQTQKLRAHDRPKPRHDELNVSPNQLTVGDKVLLDATDPPTAIFEPNGAIPLTVLNIFPYRTVEVIHPKFYTFKVNRTRLKPYFEFDSRNEECKLLAPP
ncbi:hypothetical protein GOBAR_AA25507 [Gossypium barbadense]|uniref:Uncharacterized protein n=1 Tax=Gossypium barbadense TaxID=3634 RepID=A0A2P5WVP0_GOSBA|nr:hypothetical protein GOBAR_AA25507 [Gossypium barbadense]